MTMSSSEVRDTFLRFFEERGHARLPSGPLVPPNDETLLFANAGMVQFKNVFTGKEEREEKRATTSQKCIRISGKHNDLENVGYTARHHTFFEMLGNFSFGDYFKEDAIRWSWELITERLGIDRDRLLISVFGGEDGLEADDEAEKIWADGVGLAPERIVRMGKKDNFWQMGETGPCGPCSEIHYWTGDGAPEYSAQALSTEPGPDGKGWVEIWNLVFMQFDRMDDGAFEPLPAPSIDTGAGLERLSAVCQGVVSNYDCDLLRPIVDLASEISGRPYHGGITPDEVAMRVIADHARTTAFMISEGIFPDKKERSYVLRRVMRRAIRQSHQLGIDRLFFHEAADRVCDVLGEAYPQLVEQRALIVDLCQQEETRFRRTLRDGLERIEKNEEWLGEGEARELPGDVAAKLYTTYGFPIDLTQVIAREQGFGVDMPGYEEAIRKHKGESESDATIGDEATQGVYHALGNELPATEFLGYEEERASSPIVALVANGARVDRLEGAGEVITTATPFYAESGGQVGDSGVLVVGEARFVVEDTQKPVDGLFVHRGRMQQGALAVGDQAELTVDHATRTRTRRNHSATHLLHWALRSVLGPQAMQKGSLVGPDRLRFDFASSRPITAEETARIEDLVNDKVLANAPIETEVLSMDEAKARGAIGIFEEKYGSVVRMLTMTEDSIELCGGTHAARTGDIGLFTIVSESGLAAGVRRIEAQTGTGAIAHVRATEAELAEAGAMLKAKRGEAPARITKLFETNKALQKEIEALQKKLVSGSSTDFSSAAKTVDGVTFLGVTVELGDGKALRELADQLRDKHAPAVVMLGTQAGDKALLACSVSKDITDRFQAGNLIRAAAQIVGGGGGGRPDFAQAGGSDPSKLGDAVAGIYPA